MNGNHKTKAQLLRELEDLRCRVEEQEKVEIQRKRSEEILRESEERYRSPAATEDSLYFVDREGRYRLMNSAHLLRLGLSLDEVMGRTYGDFHSEEDTKQFADRVEAVLSTGDSFQTEHRSERDNKYFLRTFSPIKDFQGNITDITIVSKDVTERRQAEDALWKSEERYRNILDSIEEGYYEVDIAGNLTFFNDSLCNLLGYSRDELLGLNSRHYTDEENAAKLYLAFNEVYRTGIPVKSFDWQVVRKDGTTGFGEVSVSPIRDEAGIIIGFRGIARDITDRKKLEEAIKTLSFKDDLTGLYNRRGFFALAEQGLKTAQRNGIEVLLLYGDLDNLKEINDTFGHQEGDLVLTDLSDILKQTFRESDIVARMGGDEFVILAMNCNEVSAEKLITRFEKSLSDYNSQRKRSYTLSLSLGTAYFNPQKSCSLEALLTRADKMMYENKQKRKIRFNGGRNNSASFVHI
jgi:diguanylate cyclase (GGDEF)-like protein/PAS domain S-box-containing protein